MKILEIHILYTREKSSGVNEILFPMINKINESGHEAYIFATDIQPYLDENYPYIKYFPKHTSHWEKGGIKNYFKKLGKKIYNLEAKDNLAKMLDDIKPDIVHIHSVWCLSFSIIKPIKDRNIPIIYTAHDASYCCPAIFCIGDKFCTACSGLNTLPCTLKKCINGNFSKSLYYSFKALIERLLCKVNDIDLILTPSEAMAKYFEKFNIPKDKLCVLNNYVPDANIKQISESSSKNYFFYAGGLAKEKGIYTLLEAVKQLPSEIEFHIAGSTDYNNDVQKIIQENQLTNIKILGRLSRTEIYEEYKNCISSIVPSAWFENFPTVVLESFANCKPSIGSKVGGIPEMIEQDKTGLLFEVNNANQLSECIMKYWNDRNLAAEHGKNAYEKLCSQYTEEKHFNKLMEIYEEVLEKHNRKS